MKRMISEALKQFRARWLRAMFSALGIMVASASMVVVNHVSQMFIQNALDTLMVNGGLSFVVHLQNTDYPLSPDDLGQVFQDIPHVSSYHPTGEGIINIHQSSVNILAISDYQSLVPIKMISGNLIREGDSYPNILITQSLEQILKEKGILAFNTPIFTDEGIIEIAGVIEDIKLPQNASMGQSALALTSHQTFENLFKQPPNKVIVTIDDIQHSDEVILHIEGQFQSLYPSVPIHIMSPKIFVDAAASLTETSSLISSILMVVCSVLGGISIMNMIIANINERKSELALRVAFGASTDQIRNMLVTETCILCLSAGFIGIIVGLGITGIVASTANIGFIIHWATLVESLVFCTFIGVAASQYPSHLVKKIPVAYLLKGE